MHKRRRARALTLTLSNDRQPSLVLEGKSFILRNLSEEGIGIWISQSDYFTPGSTLTADLVFEGHSYAVQLEVKHVRERIVGLEIRHQSQTLRQIFSKLLEPSRMAADLNLVASDEGILHYAGSHAELVVWYQPGHYLVESLQVVWEARWVFRERSKKYETGNLSEPLPPKRAVRITRGDGLIVDDAPNEEYIQLASQFLNSVPPPVQGHLLWQFLQTGELVALKMVPHEG